MEENDDRDNGFPVPDRPRISLTRCTELESVCFLGITLLLAGWILGTRDDIMLEEGAWIFISIQLNSS
jgi:hypothetical protein